MRDGHQGRAQREPRVSISGAYFEPTLKHLGSRSPAANYEQCACLCEFGSARFDTVHPPKRALIGIEIRRELRIADDTRSVNNVTPLQGVLSFILAAITNRESFRLMDH